MIYAEIIFFPNPSVSQFHAIAHFRLSLRYCVDEALNYLELSSNVRLFAFTSRATEYNAHLYTYTREARDTYTCERTFAKSEDRRGGPEKEGHSIMLSTTWPLTVRGDEGCGGDGGVGETR